MTARRCVLAADVLLADGRIAAVGPGLDRRTPARRARRHGRPRAAGVRPGPRPRRAEPGPPPGRGAAAAAPGSPSASGRTRPRSNPHEVAAAARLGIAELLAGGTTAALDMGTTHDQDAVFSAADELGIRLTSGKCHMDTGDGVPARSARGPRRLARRGRGARARAGTAPPAAGCATPWRRASCSRARPSCSRAPSRSPAGTATCSTPTPARTPDETRAVRELTGRGNVAVPRRRRHRRARHGARPLRAPRRGRVRAARPQRAPASRTARAPTSSSPPGSPTSRGCSRDGVRVGLGADGPPCNNRLSIFHEMALAGTLHNLARGAGRGGSLDGARDGDLARRRGRSASGTGSDALRPGWKADVVVLGCDSWRWSRPAIRRPW